MADSILRLKVESQEYDQKIKRAAEGIQQYAQKCREAGGTLQYLDDGVLEFVQALGKMDTVATGTKQQLREMSNALTTLTQTYRGLTDEEKASPFGQELAKGIQQLTERAGQAQDAMADVQASIRNAASDTRLFDQMAQGMSVATAGFQGLTGAGKLLGIEMGNDVEVIAKLQAAMAVTNSLTTIQTALQKQSALMQGVLAARTALASAAQTALAAATGNATVAQKAFNVVANMNPYVLLATSVTAVVGGLLLFSDNTEEATKKQDEINKKLQEGTDQAIEYANALNSAFAALQQYMSELGAASWQMEDVKLKAAQDRADRLKAVWESEMANKPEGESAENYEARIKKAYEAYDAARKELSKISSEIKVHREAVQNLLNNWESLSTEKQIRTAISAFQNLRSELKQGSKEYDEMTRRIEILQKKVSPKKTGGGGGGRDTNTKVKDKIVTGSLADLMNDLKYLQQEQTKATNTKEWETYQDAIRATQMQIKELKGELKDVPASISDATNKATDAENKKIQDRLNDPTIVSKGMAAVVKQIERDQKKDDKKEKKYLSEGLGKLGGGLGGIQSGFQQLGVDLGAGFNDVVNGLQGITTILTAIQTIVSAIQIIAGADALIPFAGGGIVRAAGGTLVGNSYSGDNLRGIGPGGQIYGLNAGEVVLNRAQVGVLAAELSSPGYNNLRLETYVSGRDLKVVLNNDSESRGKGRYLTSVNYKG